jgi:hypothetical protein
MVPAHSHVTLEMLDALTTISSASLSLADSLSIQAETEIANVSMARIIIDIIIFSVSLNIVTS